MIRDAKRWLELVKLTDILTIGHIGYAIPNRLL